MEIGGPWSRELCGGTHVRGSAQIGTLALTGESSVGSGSRRVEAVVGLEGFRYLARERDLVRQLADLLKTPQDGLVERVSGMLARLRDADKELAELRGQQTLAAAGAAGRAAPATSAASPWSPARRPGSAAATCAPWPSTSAGGCGDRPAVVLLASESGGKVALVAALNPAALAARAVGQRRAAGGGRPGRRSRWRQGRRRPGRRHRPRGYPRGAAGRRAGGRGRQLGGEHERRPSRRAPRTPVRSDRTAARAAGRRRRRRPRPPAGRRSRRTTRRPRST